MRISVLVMALAVAAPSFAADMQLVQQGRVLAASGDSVNGVHDLTVALYDGNDIVRYTETFSAMGIQDGYFSVQLGADSPALDTSVFLEFGALDIEFSIDGEALTRAPIGGYPVVVAQQSLLAHETTAQAVLAGQDALALEATSQELLVGHEGLQSSTDQILTAQSTAAQEESVQELITLLQTVAQTAAEGPAYSETCLDWDLLGWSSMASCREDGRWHYYANSRGSWDNPQGWLDWHAASKRGADTKMRIGYEWYRVAVRFTDNPANASWVHVQEGGGRHLSFTLSAAGQMSSVHATSGDATFENSWFTSGLGNWHHFTDRYTHRGSNINENQTGGFDLWARH